MAKLLILRKHKECCRKISQGKTTPEGERSSVVSRVVLPLGWLCFVDRWVDGGLFWRGTPQSFPHRHDRGDDGDDRSRQLGDLACTVVDSCRPACWQLCCCQYAPHIPLRCATHLLGLAHRLAVPPAYPPLSAGHPARFYVDGLWRGLD